MIGLYHLEFCETYWYIYCKENQYYLGASKTPHKCRGKSYQVENVVR